MRHRAFHIRAAVNDRVLLALFLALLVCLATTTARAGTVPEQASVTDAGLLPGDAIELRFSREPELNGEYPVDERGIAVLPLLGERDVSGFPISEIRQRIRAEYLRELANQAIRVTPLRRIRILGSVRNPGLYRVDATIGVADALAMAGGQTPDGKQDEIEILRSGKKIRVPLDARAPEPGWFRSSDQVFVPQRSWISRNSTVIVGGLISAAAIVMAARL